MGRGESDAGYRRPAVQRAVVHAPAVKGASSAAGVLDDTAERAVQVPVDLSGLKRHGGGLAERKRRALYRATGVWVD